MSKVSISPKSIVLCDDARREEQGKFSLIGVYTGGPIVSETPSFCEFALFCSFDVQSFEPFEISFSITSENFSAEGVAVYKGGESSGKTADFILPFFCMHEVGKDIVFRWSVSEDLHGDARWRVSVDESTVRLSPELATAQRQMLSARKTMFTQIMAPVRQD